MPKVKSFFVLVFYVLIYNLCWLFSISTAFCQQPVFRHYTTADGLPSSETYCVIQDDKGYMWFGTDRGLTRYDGYDFKVYTSGQGGLRDNMIFGLYRDHKGGIWHQAFSNNCGYWLTDSFYVYKHQKLLRAYLQSQRIEGFSIDGNDGFMATWRNPEGNFNAYYIDRNGKLTFMTSDQESPTRDIYLSDNNTVATVSNIHATTTRIISQETKQVLYTFHNRKTKNRALVCRRKNGDLLIYSSSDILLVNHQGVKRLISCKDYVLSMLLDKNDNLWVGYMNQGIDMYTGAEGYAKPQSMLAQYSISGMMQDREGGLWFTTLESGIFYLPPGFIFSYGQESGLPVSKIMCIEKVDKQLFFVLSDHSIASKTLTGTKIRLEKKKFVSDLAYKPGGPVYYGSVNFKRPPRHHNSFYFPAQMLHIGQYDIWASTQAWVFKLMTGPDTFLAISLNHIAKITSMLEIGKDELLIGTLEGLYICRSGNISSLKSHHPFFTHRISDIILMDDKHLAFASIGYGILVVDRADYSHPILYNETQGLPSNMCNILYRYDDETLLAGTNKGICMIDHVTSREKSNIYITDINNGLISNEVNDMELVDGNLWIGTAKGLSVMPIAQFRKTTEILFLNMEQVKVNDHVINYETEHRFLYDMNNMQFTFTGISYQFASKLRYKYRLKGSDARWNITSERTVIYNSLPPGSYTFDVVLIDATGKESKSNIQYHFSISPPFWETWWFIAMLAMLVTWIIYLIVARRIRSIRAQAKLQNDLNSFRDKALRAQMNPHFIYNSMNAIQNYIQKNDTRASVNYLSSFSKLMRMTFADSEKKEILLSRDLEAVSIYAEMENMRFSDSFILHITYGQGVDPARIMVPPLLIQPFVENSILHGFRPKALSGNIWIQVEQAPDRIKISIRDDGIGREKTLEAGKRKQAYFPTQDRESSGMTVTLKRLKQAWGNKFTDNMFVITDLFTQINTPGGTLIEFYLPLIKP